MPDETTPVTTETTVSAPAVSTGDNAAFARMRTELAAEKQRTTDLEEKLKEIERSKMDETERLRLEKDEALKYASELSPHKDRAIALEAKFTKLYADELASLPDDRREGMARLTQFGTAEERFEALIEAKKMFAIPVTAGTVTQPAGMPPQVQPHEKKPLAIQDVDKMSWDEAHRQHIEMNAR